MEFKEIFTLLVLSILTHGSTSTVNEKPIIGILSQELSSGMKDAMAGRNYTTYIASSYVKYFEAGGARVIPVLAGQDMDYYKHIVSSVNGIAFPGGSSFRESSYGAAGRILYDLVQEAWLEKGIQIPMMGICLGFQMLMYLASDEKDTLTRCNAKDRADSLQFTSAWTTSQLFGNAPDDVIQTLSNTDSTSNFHNYCVTEDTFTDLELNKAYEILSTSLDGDGLEYISTVEHLTLPIYGLQWHPEKSLFEWVYGSIPHTKEAVRAAQYVVNNFVDKARLVDQKFLDKDEEAELLIYNFDSVYIRSYFKSSFMECYFFKDRTGTLTTAK